MSTWCAARSRRLAYSSERSPPAQGMPTGAARAALAVAAAGLCTLMAVQGAAAAPPVAAPLTVAPELEAVPVGGQRYAKHQWGSLHSSSRGGLHSSSSSSRRRHRRATPRSGGWRSCVPSCLHAAWTRATASRKSTWWSCAGRRWLKHPCRRMQGQLQQWPHQPQRQRAAATQRTAADQALLARPKHPQSAAQSVALRRARRAANCCGVQGAERCTTARQRVRTRHGASTRGFASASDRCPGFAAAPVLTACIY